MTPFNTLALAARIATRTLRSGVRGLWLLVAGVLIGTSAVALVGTTTQSLIDGARLGALESVGGDISLRLFHRGPSEEQLKVIRQIGAVSITAEVRPMARATKKSGAVGSPLLIELKGVDKNYPLYGSVELLPALSLHQTLKQQDGIHGAVADRALYDQLGLSVGDHVQIGSTQYQLRGLLIVEPDRAFRAFTLGPRMMVQRESLAASGITDDGAEVYFYSRVRIPTTANTQSDTKAALAHIDQTFPQAGWRMVNAHEGVPGVERTLAIAQTLLLFIGMGVLLIGGAGISGAVRAHVAAKMETIAILKSVGAPPRVVSLTVWLEVMAAASIGIMLGIGVGAFGPLLASSFLGELPFSIDPIPAFKPLLVTALFGFTVTALFAWGPLLDVQKMNARVLLRTQTADQPGMPTRTSWLGIGLILLALVLLVVWASPKPVLSVSFLLGALVLAAFYYACGILLARMAKVLANGRGAAFRLALSNLYRTGAPTGPVVMALGLTLTLLVALDGIGNAASRHLQKTLPHSAPDLVGFSIKPESVKPFTSDLASSELIERQRIMPFLHARLQAIDGKAVRDLDLPKSMSWVIRGDRGVSFAAHLPESPGWDKSHLGGPGFSVDADVATKLGLQLGQTLTMNISGHIRTGEILNFHQVDWTGLDLDFPIIATPNTLKTIPHTFAASLKAKPGKAAELETFIKERSPDIPLVRVADVIFSLGKALDGVLAVLQTAVILCGTASLIVLAGSVLQGLRQRTNEILLFKVLGARRSQLLSQLTFEFLGLGTLVAVTAVPLGLSIAYGVGRAAGLDSPSISWMSGVGLAMIAILVTLIVGLLTTLTAFTTSPAKILRNRHP